MDDNPYRAPQSHRYDRDDAERDDSLDEARGPLHHEADPTGKQFRDAARRGGLVVDGLRFVFDAMAWTTELIRPQEWSYSDEVQLCIAVVRYAEEIYDRAALDALRDWGIHTGADIGRHAEVIVQNCLARPPLDRQPPSFAAIGPLGQFCTAN
jgi:hypothetical protein